MKRGGGRRYYRPEDVDLLRGIRHLLYDEGYTINGVQRILRERGVRQVQAVGRAVVSLAAQPELVHGGNGQRAGALSGVFDYLPSLRAPRTEPAPEYGDAPGQDLRDDDLAPIPFRPPYPPAEPTVPAPPPMEQQAQAVPVPSDAARILRATLHELTECRRLLDAAREQKA
jgi:DNA-binding transcriptional MerR regulator